jgi:hypothetical protein
MCSASSVQTPACPKCGTLAGRYGRYEESYPDGALSVTSTVRLSWTCSGCGSDVAVESKPQTQDGSSR